MGSSATSSSPTLSLYNEDTSSTSTEVYRKLADFLSPAALRLEVGFQRTELLEEAAELYLQAECWENASNTFDLALKECRRSFQQGGAASGREQAVGNGDRCQ